MNIVTKPHMRHGARFISADRKKAAERAAKQEVNYAGIPIPTKQVIRLHESFVDGKIPSGEWLKGAVREFFQEFGRRPTTLALTGRSLTSKVILYMPEAQGPGDEACISLQVVQGEFTEVR